MMIDPLSRRPRASLVCLTGLVWLLTLAGVGGAATTRDGWFPLPLGEAIASPGPEWFTGIAAQGDALHVTSWQGSLWRGEAPSCGWNDGGCDPQSTDFRWRRVQGPVPGVPLYAVVAGDPDGLAAVGGSGQIRVSDDAGEHWSAQESGGVPVFLDAAWHADGDKLTAVGPHGVWLRTHQVEVTLNAGSGGAVEVDNEVLPRGDTAVLRLTPDPGMVVDALSGCPGRLAEGRFFTFPLLGDCTLQVTFAPAITETTENGIIANDPADRWQPLAAERGRFERLYHDTAGFVAIAGDGEIALSDDARHWQTRREADQKTLLNDITRGPPGYVAVGDGILFSADGRDWAEIEYNAPETLLTVTWSDRLGIYLAGGRGHYAISGDGRNWFLRAFPQGQGEVTDVIWWEGVERFVAITEYRDIWTSDDGKNWSLAHDAPQGDWRRYTLASGEQGIIALDQQGRHDLLMSRDGLRWMALPNAISYEYELPEARWLSTIGIFAVIDELGVIHASRSGFYWQPQTTGQQPPDSWRYTFDPFHEENRIRFRDLIRGGDEIGYLAAAGAIYQSEDGQAWRPLTPDPPHYNGVEWIDELGLFVAVANRGMIRISADGMAWSRVPSGVDADLLELAWGDGELLVIAADGTLLASEDGRAWSARGRVPIEGHSASDILWRDGRYLVTNQYTVYVSQDGASWSQGEVDFGGYPVKELAVFNGQFFTATPDTLFASSDGMSWNTTPLEYVEAYFQWFTQAVAANAERLLVSGVGGGGAMVFDANGQRLAALGGNAQFQDILWAEETGLFVGVDSHGDLYCSPDGIAWSEPQQGPGAGVRDLAWSPRLNRWIAVGRDGFLSSAAGAVCP